MKANEAIQILEENSPLAVFPDLLNITFQNCKAVEIGGGDVIRKVGSKVEHILIPLEGELKAYVPTGRTGESKVLHKYSTGALVGLSDNLTRETHGSTIVSDKASKILYIQGHIFKKWIKDNPDTIGILNFLNFTPAVLKFALECLKKRASHERVVKVLKNIKQQSQLLSEKSPILDLDHTLFVESGSGYGRVFEDGQPLHDVLLYPGVVIGNQLLEKKNSVKIQIFPSSNLCVHKIENSKIFEILGQQVCEQIATEMWSEEDQITNIGISTESHIATKLSSDHIHSFFKGVDVSKIRIAKTAGPEAAFASLCNICLLLGSTFSTNHAQIEVQLSQHLSLGRLAEILERQGLITRCLRTTMTGLKRQKFPLMILYRGRPSVMVAANDNEIFILDPLRGLLGVHPEDIDQDWMGQALEVQVSPIEHSLEIAAEKKTLHNLVEICNNIVSDLLKDNKSYSNLYRLGLICVALEAFLPQFFQFTLDKVLSQKNFLSMPTMAIGFGLIVLAVAVGNCMRSYFAEIKSNSQNLLVSSVLLRQLMQIPGTSVGSSKAGDYNSRFFVIEGIVHYWNVVNGTLKIVYTMIGITLVMILFYSWRIALVAIFTAAAHFWVRKLAMGKRLHSIVGLNTVRQRGYDDFIEHLSNIAQIKSRNSQEKVADRVEESLLGVCEIYKKGAAHGTLGMGLGEIISGFGMGIGTLLLIFGAKDHSISPGVFVSFTFYMGMFWMAIKKWGDIAESQAFLSFEIGALAPFVRTDLEYSKLYSHTVQAAELKGKIRFEKVSYKYNSNNGFGLNDLNFTILPGQTIAIVGQNGSGKTTLGKVLAGLIRPKSGSIYFDDIDSKFISNFSIRDQIGYISHKPVIFEGTVLSNIAFGDDSPDINRAREAAAQACASEFIEGLPGGFNFYLNGSKNSLSMGQQMLIQISRALYRNPKILIIDDASVSIDAHVAQNFANNLQTLMNSRTVILISHRISALRQVDKIIVLKKGVIFESGTHDELMKKNREYMQLFRSQVNAY